MTQRIFFALTSHDRNGPKSIDTASSSFYLSEVTYPLQVVVDVAHTVNFISPKCVPEAMLRSFAATDEKRD